MAVIDTFPGLEVTVQVDGKALKEYRDDQEEVAENEIVQYIEAISGKEFRVKVETTAGFKYRGNRLRIAVYGDGIKADSVLMSDAPDTWEAKGFDTGHHIKKFCFAVLETASDGRKMNREVSQIEALGTLRVEVSHRRLGRKADSSSTLPGGAHADMGIMSEKVLKGKSLSHSIGSSGTTENSTNPRYSSTEVGGKNSTAAFEFRYRSLEALKSILIIPRTPTPPPLEKRGFDTLSREEMIEVYRRYQQDREIEENKVKIKRERTDENPRPRKTARPNAGDTQLEIDEDGSYRESSTATLGRRAEPEVIELD